MSSVLVKLVYMKFTDWLEKKFLEWELTQNRRQSYSAFARYLGVKVPLLTQWRLGNNLPSTDSVRLLSAKLGQEVYDVLGLVRPGKPLDPFPPLVRTALESAMSRITAAGLDADSHEAQRIFDEAMTALGYRKISNLDDESAA